MPDATGMRGRGKIGRKTIGELNKVTIDKSLKVRRGALSNRNVLTRVERIAKLAKA